MPADVRALAVQVFDAAAVAVLASGDRPLEEVLHRLAVDLGHHDTSDRTLTVLMRALTGRVTTE